MIDRFNFYDIYGYVIPGFFLLFFLWLPHAVVTGQGLPADLTSAVVAVVIAYVTGHVLQVAASKTVPSTRAVRGIDGKIAYLRPSDYLLDQADPTLTLEQKNRIGEKIKKKFGVTNPASAFLSCRNTLVAEKVASYAEQFEGMYVLMRGICAASAIGIAYIVGCLWQRLASAEIAAVGMVVLVAVVATVFRYELPRQHPAGRTCFALLLAGTAVCAGMLTGSINDRGLLPLSLVSLVLLLVALWTFGAYQTFAKEWAKTVYLAFDLLDSHPTKSD